MGDETYHAKSSSCDMTTMRPRGRAGASIGIGSSFSRSCSSFQVRRREMYDARETNAEGMVMSLVSSASSRQLLAISCYVY